MGRKLIIKTPKVEAKPPPPVRAPVPKQALAEFKTSGPLQLKRLKAPCGPAIADLVCTGSWAVMVDDDKVMSFLEVSQEIGNVTRLYHGTQTPNVSAIAEQGLRKGSRSCMFGAGIYFGGPDKAIGYAWGRDDDHKARYIFEAEVALGRRLVATSAHKYTFGEIDAQGYHSVHGKPGVTKSWGGTLCRDEYVIYSGQQILLDKVHEYVPRFEVPAFRPSPPTGLCALSIRKPVVITRGNKAFADVIGKTTCNAIAYVQVRVRDFNHALWICNSCIARDKLTVGSKVEIKTYSRVVATRITAQL